MPELPEVESVRRGLEGYLPGRTFERVEVLHPRANRGQEGPLDQLLVGREIGGVARRGKFMWIEFADENLHDPGRDVSSCTWACPARCGWGDELETCADQGVVKRRCEPVLY